MRFHRVLAIGVGLLGIGWGAGCVGDSGNPIPDGGNDGTAPADGGAEASKEAGPCVVIPSTPGVQCLTSQCTPGDVCCIGVSGTWLSGVCGDASPTTCSGTLYTVPWSCDKAADCPGSMPKCCTSSQAASTLFGSLNTGTCPVPVLVDAGDAGAPPYVASCMTSCPSLQLCASDSECSGANHCVPIAFPGGKIFGACLP